MTLNYIILSVRLFPDVMGTVFSVILVAVS